jgi:hypothetical protein
VRAPTISPSSPGDGEVLGDRALGGQDGRITVGGRRVESLNCRLAVAVPLSQQEVCGRLCGGGPDVAGDQVEGEVVPGGSRPRADQPPAVA